MFSLAFSAQVLFLATVWCNAISYRIWFQALRVNWEQLLTAIARNINEIENQVLWLPWFVSFPDIVNRIRLIIDTEYCLELGLEPELKIYKIKYCIMCWKKQRFKKGELFLFDSPWNRWHWRCLLAVWKILKCIRNRSNIRRGRFGHQHVSEKAKPLERSLFHFPAGRLMARQAIFFLLFVSSCDLINVFFLLQILTRDSKGISEEQMKEFRNSFNHFDKVCNQTGFALYVSS